MVSGGGTEFHRLPLRRLKSPAFESGFFYALWHPSSENKPDEVTRTHHRRKRGILLGALAVLLKSPRSCLLRSPQQLNGADDQVK